MERQNAGAQSTCGKAVALARGSSPAALDLRHPLSLDKCCWPHDARGTATTGGHGLVEQGEGLGLRRRNNRDGLHARRRGSTSVPAPAKRVWDRCCVGIGSPNDDVIDGLTLAEFNKRRNRVAR